MINASISMMLNFYFFKSHFLGLIQFILKKRAEKEKAEEDKKAIPMVDIEENKEDKENKIVKVSEEKETKKFLSDRQEFWITLGCYLYVIAMAIGFDKIIVLDSFNGSTVANYINIIAPCMFYLYFAKDKKNNCGDKTIAGFNVLFGSWLIIFYFILLFF